MRALVIGAGLAGLAAAEKLLDAGANVTVVDAFPVPGGRTASFEAPTSVAGLTKGDIVEHGLHAWFQHYHALFGLMERAQIPKPAFAGEGVYFWHPDRGHYAVEGGPFFWLVDSLRLPEAMRGPRGPALAGFGRLIGNLGTALAQANETDEESALTLLRRVGIPEPALEHVFRPCLFSLTSLPLEELSALEFLRWMSGIIPDPRIRCLEGGGTRSMSAPIANYLAARGAEFRLGVEVTRLSLEDGRRVRVTLAKAPDRTGVRHVLVPGFTPAEPPDGDGFDAIVCTLPWERLLEVSRGDGGLSALPAWQGLRALTNVHPVTLRLWFERPIRGPGALPHYILSSGTVFDVLRPTPEPHRYGEQDQSVRLIDALVENVETTGLRYQGERFFERGAELSGILRRTLEDLERLFPGQIRDNVLARHFVHTREGILACRPGTHRHRPPQFVGLPGFVLAGDWTRQPFGVCMEGAVRSGQLAVEALLAGRTTEPRPWAFRQVAYSVRSLFHRA
jgi:15-cis-phytoene desaturase